MFKKPIDKIFLRPVELSDADIRLEVGMSKTTYYRKKKEAITLFVMILVTPGQHSCNTRTRFLSYPDRILESFGQDS